MPIPNDLRQMNRRQVLLASLKSGPATRSILARATGISAPTMGKIIDELIEDGVLRETSEAKVQPAKAGRPGYFVKVDDVQPRFLGVHLGIAETRVAVLAVAPMLQDAWTQVIPTVRHVAGWVELVTSAATSLSRGTLAGVLVSVPGVADRRSGVTTVSPHLSWMEGENVAAALGTALGLPALAVREFDCLAVGHRAVNPTADSFLLVDFDVGIGSAAMVRGGLFRGAEPFAGELGHSPVAGHHDLCACGGVGCLETIAGRHRMFLSRHSDSDTLSAAEVDELKKSETVTRVAAALEVAGATIATSLNVLGLNHVVITGFVSDLPPESFAVLRRSIAASAVASRFGQVRVDAVPRHRLAGLASVGIDRLIVPVNADTVASK